MDKILFFCISNTFQLGCFRKCWWPGCITLLYHQYNTQNMHHSNSKGPSLWFKSFHFHYWGSWDWMHPFFASHVSIHLLVPNMILRHIFNMSRLIQTPLISISYSMIWLKCCVITMIGSIFIIGDLMHTFFAAQCPRYVYSIACPQNGNNYSLHYI